jgi:hypothetical protein
MDAQIPVFVEAADLGALAVHPNHLVHQPTRAAAAAVLFHTRPDEVRPSRALALGDAAPRTTARVHRDFSEANAVPLDRSPQFVFWVLGSRRDALRRSRLDPTHPKRTTARLPTETLVPRCSCAARDRGVARGTQDPVRKLRHTRVFHTRHECLNRQPAPVETITGSGLIQTELWQPVDALPKRCDNVGVSEIGSLIGRYGTHGKTRTLRRSDSGRSDSGRSNSGRSNSGRSNSGRSDSGRSDSGRSDSGRSDSGRSNLDNLGSGSLPLGNRLRFGG